MGRRHHKIPTSQTLPSSPTHSSSSSDFEFTVSISPRKSTTNLIPADQLFYKGQLLPLHLSPRLSMVRTLLLASSSTSSSSDTTTTTASRHSTASSSSDFPDSRDSSRRPSSVTDDDTSHSQPLTRLFNPTPTPTPTTTNKKPKYLSFSRFSSVFRKEPKLATSTTTITSNYDPGAPPPQGSVKRVSSTAKDVIRKYLKKKVKPLYDKLSQKQGASTKPTTFQTVSATDSTNSRLEDKSSNAVSHSFSGNLRYPRRTSCVASCPSSMRSSPNHSGVLSRTAVTLMNKQFGGASTSYSSEASTSMEELHNAIQGAIAHCKNSMSISNINNNNTCSTSGSTSTTTLTVSNEI